MIILLPLLVCLIGLIMYALSANEKVRAIGLQMFWVGLLVTLLNDHAIVNVLPR